MLEEEKGLLKLENQEPFGHNSVSGFELYYHIRIPRHLKVSDLS